MNHPTQLPLHMLPVPRPMPSGAASHKGDTPFVIWVVIFALLACFGVYYGGVYAHYPDQQVGGLAAGAAFALLAGLTTIPWLRARGRRKRLLTMGRAVPGAVLETTNVTVRMQHGGYLGHYRMQTIAFEDKQVRLKLWDANPTPAVFVDGAWAAVFTPPSSVEMAKWQPRMQRASPSR